MRKIKKSLMACLIAIFALTLGAGFASMPKANTAKAAVATEYTVVEAPMMGGIQDCYAAGGNLNLFITIPGLDNEVDGDGISFEGVDLASVFNSFGFFDNVMIGGKTLRELGCTSFWDNTLGYNIGEPKPRIYLHAHFDPAILAAAIEDGTVNYGHTTMSTITFKEGTIIPGYRYLKGLDNAVLYKAGCEYNTEASTFLFERTFIGTTEVQSLKYIQDNGDGTGYFGISLFGDDYVGVGNQEDGVGNSLNGAITTWYYNDTVLLNGEAGKVGNYSLINLGDKGKGYYAFNVRVSEAELASVTIPAGTKFPMYFYRGAQGSGSYNNGNKVVSYYEIKTTKTFVKDEYGAWYCPDDVEEIETEVTMAKAFYGDGVGNDYFLNIELSANDYDGLNTYGGNVQSVSNYLVSSNLKTHILVNGAVLPAHGESYLNVWGAQNTFSTRGNVGDVGFTNATQVETITILAGAKFPSHELLETGERKYYVTTEDVTFVKVAELEWEVQREFNLEEYKAEKIAELQAYRRGEVENEADREELVEIGIEWITESTDKEEVDGALADIKVEIDDLPAKADVSALVAAAKAELDGYLADGDYTDLQVIDRRVAVAQGKALIEVATTEEEVADALAEAKALVEARINREINYVDVTVLVRISDINAAGGNMNLFLMVNGLDTLEKIDGKIYAGYDEVTLEALFDALGLYDNIYLNDKSLREWGFVGFWDGSLGYNIDPPKSQLYLHMHTDNPAYAEAVASGAITFTKYIDGALAIKQSPVTAKEGLLIPGHAYLNGEDNATLYRVNADVTTAGEGRPYDIEAKVDTVVDSVAYVQDDGNGTGYFGISLEADDYPVEGDHFVVNEGMRRHATYDAIIVNGKSGLVNKYALYNLGTNGKGRIAFSVQVSEADMYSITIPAGTLFPSYTSELFAGNNSGNLVYIYFRTTSDITFVKTADGSWVEFSNYKANALETLENAKNEKVEADYFANDFAVIENAYQTAKDAIVNATSATEIDNALAAAIEAMNATSTKTGAIAAAKEEIAAYKAGMFREAEEAQRLAIVEAAQAELDACDSEEALAEALAAAKAEVDALKTAAQYADEELADLKASARDEIVNYLDKANYYADEQAEIDLAIAAGRQGVADATNEAEIAQAVVDAKAELDEILTKEEVVEAIKADLNAYKAVDVFREEEQAERDNIVAEALAALEGLTDKAEIDAIVEAAKAEIDELTTADEYLEAELATLKAEAKAEVESYRADGDYIPSQVRYIEEAIAEALEAIAEAKSLEEIAVAVEVAKANIDGIADSVTIVDVAMMVQITDINHNGGNLNMFVIIPGLDLPENVGDGKVYDNYSKETLEALFNDFGLYDMIYINGKSLRDWGFVGFWNDSVGFNIVAPNPAIYLHMHTDNPDYAAAVESGEITFTTYKDTNNDGTPDTLDIMQSPVTAKEGLLIPGHAFLSGDDNAVVYRAVADFVTEGAHRPYDLEATATTNVESIVYVQEDRDPETNEFTGYGYFGFSLEGDDYPAFEGDSIGVNAIILNFVNYDSILINGEEGLVNKYALYNLGEKGRGYVSVQVTIAEADMYSVTIPAGTLFPAYAVNTLADANTPNLVYLFYKTTEEVTFVKTADGSWTKFEDYVQSAKDTLEELKAEKETIDCFAADLVLLETVVADAMADLDEATSVEEVDAIFANAKAVLDAVQAKTEIIAAAKADLDTYKVDAFRAEEEAQRLAAVATASAAIDAANSSEEVATAVANAKATIDALKTANEYAKEEIADSVADAKSSLDSYKAEANLYREEEAAERLAIIAEAKATLEDALTEDEVETILANAKAAIDALKTDAEYDAEEYLAMVKEDSVAQIGEKKDAIDLSLYSEESISTISTLYNNAISAIQNANSEEEIAAILTKFEADLNNVPKIGEENTSEPAAPSAPSGGGCFGGIGGLSSVFALLSVMAVAVVLKKRR